MQELLVGLIVFAVLVWFCCRLFRAFRSGGCAGGCSACGKTDCAAAQTEAERRD